MEEQQGRTVAADRSVDFGALRPEPLYPEAGHERMGFANLGSAVGSVHCGPPV